MATTHPSTETPPEREADVARAALAFGDASRVRVLLALGDGRRLPASVLAAEAGVSASTVSGHLARLGFPLLLARPWGAATWTTFYRDTLSRGRKGPRFDEQVAAVRAALSRPRYLAQFRRLALHLTHAPVTARLEEVHAPVLAFVGRLDPDYPDPVAEATWFEERLGADVHLLDDVAHYPQHQAAELVVPAVLDFLASLPATAT